MTKTLMMDTQKTPIPINFWIGEVMENRRVERLRVTGEYHTLQENENGTSNIGEHESIVYTKLFVNLFDVELEEEEEY